MAAILNFAKTSLIIIIFQLKFRHIDPENIGVELKIIILRRIFCVLGHFS